VAAVPPGRPPAPDLRVAAQAVQTVAVAPTQTD
jgi:hypothetical protein